MFSGTQKAKTNNFIMPKIWQESYIHLIGL